MEKKKIIRVTTNAISLNLLLKGQLSFLVNYYNVIAVSGANNHLYLVKEREGVAVCPIHIERKISLFNDFISLVRLIYLFSKEKPEIVHSITPKAGLLSMLAAKFTCVPIRIHTFTGLIFPTKNGILKQILIFMDKVLCKASTNIYAEGKGVKNDLIKYRITDKTIKIIANGNINGINCDYFNPSKVSRDDKLILRNKLEIIEGDFVFIYAGRLVSDKGINELIIAFQDLKHKNFKLILLGDYEEDLDPLLPETLKIIKSNTHIITPGFVEDVRLYFSISDVFVFPSYREGFPNVLLQAASMALPCIVTNINGSNEIIINDYNGLIIPPQDIKALRDSMLSLFENTDNRKYLASNSRNLICLNYNQRLVWNATKSEYDSLIRKIQSNNI